MASEDNVITNETEVEEQDNSKKFLGIQLLTAVRTRKPKDALKLITRGADIHLKDAAGWNCLHYAALEGYADVIRLLLAHDANIVCQDTDGQTPLHKAASSGQTDAILLIVAFGPKIFTLDKHGQFPLEMAVKNKREKAVELLLMFGSELALQDWSWTINPNLNKQEKKMLEYMARQQKLAPGFKFGGIQYDLRHIQPNTIVKMNKLEVSISSEDFRTEFYLYCCRMQTEFTDMKTYISNEEEEELFSDVYDVRTWNLNKKVLTLTVTAQGVPRKHEKINFIAPTGVSGRVNNVENMENENKTAVTVTLKLSSSGSTRFALTVVERKEKVAVSKRAVTIKPEAEPEAEIDIPKNTFSTAGELSLQLVDTTDANEEFEDTDTKNAKSDKTSEETKPGVAPALVTSVLDISMSDGQQPQKEIPIKLPIHKNEGIHEFVVLASYVSDSTDVKDWQVIPAQRDQSGKAAVFSISHFSIYAGANKKKVDENMKEVITAVVNSMKKVRKIEFAVLTRPPKAYDRETDVIVVCGSQRKIKVLQKLWINSGYVVTSQSNEAFEVPEGQEFKIHLIGRIKETNGNDVMPLCFKTNDQDNFRQFQICSKNQEDENSEGRIEIKTEEKCYPKTVVEVDAGGCFGGKVEKEITSDEPVMKLNDIVEFAVNAKFKKKKPETQNKGIDEEEEEEENIFESFEELIRKDESIISVLGWKNLLVLCKAMDDGEATMLGLQLRFSNERLEEMLSKAKQDGDLARMILMKWRGKRPHKAQVETLVQALRAINRADDADRMEKEFENEAKHY